jgi:hypothetical protein
VGTSSGRIVGGYDKRFNSGIHFTDGYSLTIRTSRRGSRPLPLTAQSGRGTRIHRCPLLRGKADTVLGSLSRFVHWSFVTPNKFRVRMIMVPHRAGFAVVPMAFCSGFAGRLSGALSFGGRGLSVVGTKHISSPSERDNAWLLVTAHRAAVGGPEPIAAIRRKLGGDQAFPQSLQPDERAKRSTWAKRLGKPGDCNVARRKLCGER